MKTYHAKTQEIERAWWLVDAGCMPLGRLATRLATILQGKHKPTYTPSVDTGDVVVVVNARQIQMTGNKRNDKKMYYHTGYPGGIKSPTYDEMMAKDPTRVLKLAVRRMLPKGPLGRAMLSKLKIYVDAKHPHEAQQPKTMIMEA